MRSAADAPMKPVSIKAKRNCKHTCREKRKRKRSCSRKRRSIDVTTFFAGIWCLTMTSRCAAGR
jgi:hypothetical protein